MVTTQKKRVRVPVHADEIPAFQTEAEEVEFWRTHSLGDDILDRMEPDTGSDILPPPRPRTKPVSLRLEESTLQRARELARRRHTGYQTLLKEFIIERLYEEEKREGILGEERR